MSNDHFPLQIAFLRNFSAVVSVNGGQLLPPGQFDQRFFLIQDVIRHDHSMLIVSEHQSLLPLYLFSKQDNSLTPLTTLQLIEVQMQIHIICNTLMLWELQYL
jgi:hypothetical protein